MASNILDGFKSLFSPTNKGENDEKITREEYTPTLPKTPEGILKLTQRWKNDWEAYSGDAKKGLSKKQKKSEEYWLGEQFQDGKSDVPLQDNLIFEAVETFLPMATAKNPDPVVASEDQKLEDNVQKALYVQGERLFTKSTMKMAVRHWALFFYGATKTFWDPKRNDFFQRAIHPKKMILDKEAYVDPGGNYYGSYIGERKRAKWEQLLEMFPDSPHYAELKEKADMNGKDDVEYVEWWTTDNLFYTTKELVLGVYDYPHWNEDRETIDEMGEPTMEKGDNQFDRKIIPYTILTIFNLGEGPVDVTSLIWQNIPNQDFINKRMRQVDRNADNMNNGLVLSGEHFTKEQAAEAARHKQKGGALWVPKGDVNKAYRWDSSPALPEQVFAHLQDSRSELRNIFGIQGSTAQGISQDQTVRGKMLRGQADQSRVGGLVSEAIERYVATLYNWQVQMMKVYYTDERKLIFEGSQGTESITVSSLILKGSVQVTVKEGSMIPRNPLEERNQAVELFQMGVMSPVTLYKKLGFPNPMENVKELSVWMMVQSGLLPPTVLMLPVEEAMQMGQQALAAQQQAAQQQAQAEGQAEQMKAQSEMQVNQQKMEMEQQKGQMEMAHTAMQNEMELERSKQEMIMQQKEHAIDLAQKGMDISQVNQQHVFKHAQMQQQMKHAEEKHAMAKKPLRENKNG